MPLVGCMFSSSPTSHSGLRRTIFVCCFVAFWKKKMGWWAALVRSSLMVMSTYVVLMRCHLVDIEIFVHIFLISEGDTSHHTQLCFDYSLTNGLAIIHKLFSKVTVCFSLLVLGWLYIWAWTFTGLDQPLYLTRMQGRVLWQVWNLSAFLSAQKKIWKDWQVKTRVGVSPYDGKKASSTREWRSWLGRREKCNEERQHANQGKELFSELRSFHFVRLSWQVPTPSISGGPRNDSVSVMLWNFERTGEELIFKSER